MKLAEKADVIVENFRSTVKHRLGVDYDTVKKINPRIVYGSHLRLWPDGPYAKRPGVDQIAQGMGGLMSITGFPGQGPVRVGASIMAANNEIGTFQPVAELGSLCREHGIVFHTDAAQWFGKLPFETIGLFNADLVSVCAHKFHGPKGAGLLYIKSPLLPVPIAFGGGHENERRAGTENLAGIIGLVEAMERFLSPPVFKHDLLFPLTRRLIDCLSKNEGVEFVGSSEERLANTASFVVEGADSIALLGGLDIEGICASSGSACSAGSLVPSHVVVALGKQDSANSLVRFSLGRDSSLEDVDYVSHVFSKVALRAQLGQ